ncbi:hypothetical protein [Streptomyces wuyuanensis]|uniref:hypothetical protein n=1 Tax=Streptomyces wuyuanensis TaxID=1196353 RepID=UPI003D72FD02
MVLDAVTVVSIGFHEPSDSDRHDSGEADSSASMRRPASARTAPAAYAFAETTTGAAVLLASGGLVGYGVLNAKVQPKPRAVPTAEVTYEVTGTGTAEVAYLARSGYGTATVEKGVTLPWKKSVEVPLGKAPSVAVVLDEKGGRASCTLAVRGQHVQRATAMGEFGRATCSGELPAAAGAGED